MDTAKKSRKWAWLRWNNFFGETPVIGFSFIAASKSRIEVVFWYILILTFMGFTIYNVENLVSRYKGRPTSTSVRPTASTSHVNLTNITITLNLSVYDFFDKTRFTKYNIVDTTLEWYMLEKASPTSAYCYSSTLTTEEENVGENTFKKTFNLKLFQEIKKLVEFLMGYSIGYDLDINLKRKQLVVEWYDNQTLLQEHGQELMSVLEQHKEPNVETLTQGQRIKIGRKFDDAFDGPLDYINFGLKTITKLQLLNTVLNGELLSLNIFPEIIKLVLDQHDIVKDTHKADLELIKMKKLTAEELLKSFNIRVDDLYSSVMNDLNELLSIAVYIDGQYSNPNYHLIDTTTYISGGRDKDFLTSEEEATVQDFKQQLTFLIVLPPETKNVKMEISTLPHLWMSYTLDALQTCSDLSTGFNGGSAELMLEIRNYIMEVYKKELSLDIETNMGRGIYAIQPYSDNDIFVKPTGVFYSQTEGCYENSYQYCFSECLNRASKEQCGCFLWTQQHLNMDSSFPMCGSPCKLSSKNQSKCATDCDAKMQHSCHIAAYNLGYISYVKTELLLHLSHTFRHEPLYILNFEMVESLNHPTFVESYQLTFSQFMAELGGILELWLGINVIGIIHLLVFIFKHLVFHSQDTIVVATEEDSHEQDKGLEVLEDKIKEMEKKIMMNREIIVELSKEHKKSANEVGHWKRNREVDMKQSSK